MRTLPETQVPGWLIVQLRRHEVTLPALTRDELASLGPALADVSKALVDATGAERVYTIRFSENIPHVHFLLAARTPNIATEHRAAAFLQHSDKYRDQAAALRVAARVRDILRSQSK